MEQAKEHPEFKVWTHRKKTRLFQALGPLLYMFSYFISLRKHNKSACQNFMENRRGSIYTSTLVCASEGDGWQLRGRQAASIFLCDDNCVLGTSHFQCCLFQGKANKQTNKHYETVTLESQKYWREIEGHHFFKQKHTKCWRSKSPTEFDVMEPIL